MAVASAHALRGEVESDAKNSTGVTWWTGLDDGERTVITDHLLQCVEGIEENLVDAELHRLQLLDAVAQDAGFHAQALEYGRDGLPGRPILPAREQPAQDLPDRLVHLHASGFFRGVTAAFDCLAGVVVGVVGLNRTLIKADFDGVLKAEDNSGILGAVRTLVTESGPPGWYQWVTGMRNLMMHRPRRFQIRSWQPMHEYAGLVSPTGRATRMARPQWHMPSEPGMADFEALVKDAWLPLDEDLMTTIDGVRASALRLCEASVKQLTEHWRKRRTSPELHPQPKKQVPDLADERRSSFQGFTGKGAFQADQMITSPRDLARIAAAQQHRKPGDSP